jgi:hypothetical protein
LKGLRRFNLEGFENVSSLAGVSAESTAWCISGSIAPEGEVGLSFPEGLLPLNSTAQV